METAEVIIPALETLVTIDGTLSRPVKHIQFNGITFAHTSWMRPSFQGHVTLQGGFPLLDAYKLQEPGLPLSRDSYHSPAGIHKFLPQKARETTPRK